MAGSIETTIRIIILHEAPMGLGYGSNNLQLSIGDTVQVIPSTTGGEIVSWSVEPPFPEGLNLMQIDRIKKNELINVLKDLKKTEDLIKLLYKN